MKPIERIGPKKVASIYDEIAEQHKKHLAIHGVKLPKLMTGEFFSLKALTLICLYLNLGEPVTKADVTEFCLINGAKRTNDLQPRHLATQDGWNILLKRNSDIGTETWPPSSYGLLNITTPKPGFRSSRRKGTLDEDSWTELLREFNNCCATCGSEAGKPNRHDPNSITKLEKGHCDPDLPLNLENCIPQCQKCNRDLGSEWVWDQRGKPRAINDPGVIRRSSESVRRQVLEILIRDFRAEPDDN